MNVMPHTSITYDRDGWVEAFYWTKDGDYELTLRDPHGFGVTVRDKFLTSARERARDALSHRETP